jgi:ATP-binding cassette subfamily C protein CydD
MILGLPTLKIFGASKQEIANLHTLNRAYRTSTMKVLRMAFLSSFVLEFFATVSIALIAVFVGFRLMWGEMSYFDGLFVLLLAPEFYAPIRRVGVMYHMRMEAYAAIEHMAAALADAPTTPPHTASLTESAPIPAPQGLDLRDVCYRYPGQHDDTVCNISLSLRTGQVHALIGPSGAGKTTLARLILGVLPATHGEITLHPSTTAASTAPLPLTPDIIPAYMPHVAYVPQTPTIFDGTIAENIAIGRTLDMAAIEKAAQKAHLHATIIALPDGYQTPLAESGKNFSGGQVQRLALARAFYRDAAIIVLDEPTAHLDHRTEQDILAVLDNAKTSAAILMIAHRLHTLDHADCVSFVQNGQLIAQGAHTTLRETNAAYQNFIRFMDAQSRTGDAS